MNEVQCEAANEAIEEAKPGIKAWLRTVLGRQTDLLIDMDAEGYEGTYTSQGWEIDVKFDVRKKPGDAN